MLPLIKRSNSRTADQSCCGEGAPTASTTLGSCFTPANPYECCLKWQQQYRSCCCQPPQCRHCQSPPPWRLHRGSVVDSATLVVAAPAPSPYFYAGMLCMAPTEPEHNRWQPLAPLARQLLRRLTAAAGLQHSGASEIRCQKLQSSGTAYPTIGVFVVECSELRQP